MQCAARSRPASRSRPRSRCRISFVPTPSVDAARKRPSGSSCRPANAPKPRAPVESTAARRRSTTASALASETPAASYVFPNSRQVYEFGQSPLPDRSRSLTPGQAPGPVLEEQLAVQLRPALRAAGQEADRRLADLDGA